MRVFTKRSSPSIPHNLANAIQKIYIPAGLRVTKEPKFEPEGLEYGACRLSLNNKSFAYRDFKVTPNKKMKGGFVTLWKRPHDTIVPLDKNDVDFVVISVSNNETQQHGQFVFPQDILVKQGVMSREGKGGKLAIRVYPPWTKPTTKSAEKAQAWQCQCFLPLKEDGTADLNKVYKLFKNAFDTQHLLSPHDTTEKVGVTEVEDKSQLSYKDLFNEKKKRPHSDSASKKDPDNDVTQKTVKHVVKDKSIPIKSMTLGFSKPAEQPAEEEVVLPWKRKKNVILESDDEDNANARLNKLRRK